MQVLIALCAVAACAVANPITGFAYSAYAPLASPLAYSAPFASAYPYATPYAAPYAAPYSYAPVVAAAQVPVGVKSQYFSQDFTGATSYGFSEPRQTQNVVQDAAGNKVGSFSYINPEGKVVQTNYVADALGYRVASNDLPAAPLVQPIPVQDTPEVAEAKAKFFAEFEQTKSRARRSAVPVQTPASTTPLAVAPQAVVAPAPLAYSAAAPLAYSAYPYSAYPYSAYPYSASAYPYSAYPYSAIAAY